MAPARRLTVLLCTVTLSLGVQAQEKSAWRPLGLSGGGGMYCPSISPVDPDRALVHCDMGGAYRSSDGGRSWEMIHYSQLRGNTRCKPCWHPRKAEVAFSASGYNGRVVMRTTDGGVTWERHGELPGPLTGEIAIDPDQPRLVVAGSGERVALSRDGGETWERCEGPQGRLVGVHFDRSSRPDRRVVVVATGRGIWRSADGGRSWQLAVQGLPSTEVRSLAGSSSSKRRGRDAVVLYCCVPSTSTGDGLDGGVYRSLDRGATWQRRMGAGINLDTEAFDRWAMGPVAQYHHVLAVDSDPHRVYAFNSNSGVAQPHHATLYRSDDGGRTWRATFNPDPRWRPTNVDPYYVVAEDGQFYQSVPHGIDICATDPDRILFVTGQMFITRNGGETWSTGVTRLAPGQKLGKGSRRQPGLRWLCNGLVVTTTWHYCFDPFLPRRHYICYTDLGFASSDDRGESWRWWSEKGRAPWRNTCYELALDPGVKGRAWGAFSTIHDIPNDNITSGRHRSKGPGGVCLSTDHCRTWTPLAGGLPEGPCTSVILDPRSPVGQRRLYAGFFGHGVYASRDGGRTWKPSNHGLDKNLLVTRVQLHDDGTLFAMVGTLRQDGRLRTEGVGLHRSKDQGRTWRRISEGAHLCYPKDFMVDPRDSRVVYVGNCDAPGTDGARAGGLWRTRDGGGRWQLLARKHRQHFGAYLHPRKRGWIYLTLTEGAPGAGLWLSKDDGRTWRPLEGLPFGNAQRVIFPPRGSGLEDRIVVTTFGGSVWVGP